MTKEKKEVFNNNVKTIIYYKINYKNDEGIIEKFICKDDDIDTIQDLCVFWKYMLNELKYPQFAIMEITKEEYNGYKNGRLSLGDYVILGDHDE